MKIPRNMCIVLPPIIARNPFLIEELAGKSNRKHEDIALALRKVKQRMSTRIEEEILNSKIFEIYKIFRWTLGRNVELLLD